MEETGLVIRPFVGTWFVLLVAALLVFLSITSYRRTTRSITPRLKRRLVALRLAAMVAILLCLLRPSVQTTNIEVIKRPLVFLIDESRSMSEINDTVTGVSRRQAVDVLLLENKDRMEQLAELYDVVRQRFGRGLLGQGSSFDPTATRYSAYGLALEQAFAETDGQADAVVVIGDGSHNYGPPDPVDIAAALNEQQVPVHTVGVGEEGGTPGLSDVKVVDVAAPRSAFLFTSFAVRPQVLFRGCRGVPVKVRMEFPGQPPQVRTVTPAHDEELVPLSFEVTPEEIGDHRVAVHADTVVGEVLDTNNDFATYVKVVSGGVRVGFFDTVRPESKFVARSLKGAEHLSVRRVLTLSGGLLPIALTETGRYDVFILGDVGAASLRRSRVLELKRAVQDEGRGLIVLMAERSAGAGGWRGTPLEEILPVELPVNPRAVEGEREFVVDPLHKDHPAVALGDTPEETQRLWSEMPPLAGVVTGLKPKRAATVLAADQDGNPLLVVQRVGWGRVACLMADTTFRWYFTERNTQEHHRRFWRQLVMWAAGREAEPPSQVRLELNKQRVLLEEPVRAVLHVRDGEGRPIRDVQITLTSTDPSGRTTDLSHSFSRPDGAYVAQLEPAEPGDYAVAVEVVRAGQPLGRDVVHFSASSADPELEDPIADLSLLRRMSAATQEAGGRYFHYTQVDDLFDDLQERGRPLQLTTRERRDVWDSWLLFVVFAGCMAAEWAVRKWKGLL